MIACERNADVMNRLMTTFPFAVPFAQRAAWFNSMRLSDKEHNQSQTRGIRIVVQRAHIFDTAYNAITRISERYSLRNRLHVSFIDEFGNEEAGIDAGGLFKELWTQLAAVVFDPSYGLFAVCNCPLNIPNLTFTCLYRSFAADRFQSDVSEPRSRSDCRVRHNEIV